MNCPKCNGKIIVSDIVHNDDTQETYRKKKCIDCGHVFYTVEFITEETRQFRRDWIYHHR